MRVVRKTKMDVSEHMEGLSLEEGKSEMMKKFGEKKKRVVRKEKVEDGEQDERDKIYSELLTRVYLILQTHNPELIGDRKKYTLMPPIVQREGNKKTSFSNIGEIAAKMGRSRDHLIQFIYAELGTNGSIDGAGRLILRGRFQQKQIEGVLKRYVVEYVTCRTCRSPNTILRKDNRLFFQQCEACGSTRTVSAIRTGFQAQTERRSATKRE